MKVKFTTKSNAEITRWLYTGNLFAKSLCPAKDVLKQFNQLTSTQRLAIKELFDHYDDIRKKRISTEEGGNTWEINIMVDAHIIATEYDIDPLTAILCIKPICKSTEKLLIK